MVEELKDLLSDLSTVGADGIDGWDDMTSQFVIGATSPTNTPTYADIGNGFYELNLFSM